LKCLLAHAGPASALGREARRTLREKMAARRAMSDAFGKRKKECEEKERKEETKTATSRLLKV
jgi:hypothetical protein